MQLLSPFFYFVLWVQNLKHMKEQDTKDWAISTEIHVKALMWGDSSETENNN